MSYIPNWYILLKIAETLTFFNNVYILHKFFNGVENE